MIDKTSSIPRYYQLKEVLKKEMAGGKFLPGSRFLSDRKLMQKYKLSLMTIRQAVSELVKEGLVYREQGKGTYVREFNRSRELPQVKDIGLLFSDISNPFFFEVVKQIESFAKRTGYHTVVSITTGSLSDLKRSISLLTEKGIAALIVGPIYGGEKLSYISSFRKDHLPIVIFDCLEPTDLDYITTDRAKGSYEAVNYLIKLGHKKIAYAGTSESPGIWSKLTGFKKALLDNNISLDNNMIIESRGTETAGYRVMKAMLKRKERPSAILAHNDLAAIGMMKAIKQAGLKIPEDFSIIGYDGIESSLYTEVPLTTKSWWR